MSGLLHLVEAATALTHLPVGPANLLPSSSSAASTSPVPTTGAAALSTASLAQSYRIATHAISDDDDVTSGSIPSTNMADILRENHIQALRAAAADAGLVTTPAPAPPACQPSKDQAQPLMTAPATAQVQSPHPHQVMTRISRGGGGDGKESFPMRLLALLSDPKVRDVISWLPHGTSFVVLRPDVFATRVLPRYFAPEGSNSLNAKTTTVVGKDGSLVVKNKSPGVHKYPSFTRKLNRWGFRQISRGMDAGAFCHELFQREDPGLCRGMVCQKSRKMKKMPMSAAGGMMMDDMMSVSSASTMGTKLSIASGEKRPYSSTVTVSTAGATSNKSLPLKKRKSGQMHNFMMNGIPSTISHRSQKMAASTSSVTESDLTSDTSSSSSVCSNNAVAKAPIAAANNAVAPVAAAPNNAVASPAEATAMEVLARHFHEQHRAFALASLLENSRMAMNAAGINNQFNDQVCAQSMANTASGGVEQSKKYSPQVLGAATTHSSGVFAATVNIPEEKKMPAVADHAPAQSAADAAKNALYRAYLQALSSHSPASS